MDKGEVTIEDLARMVQKGFDETAKKIDMDARFDGVQERFNAVEMRLDRIEKLLIIEHQRRIEKLEDDVRVLKDALNIK